MKSFISYARGSRMLASWCLLAAITMIGITLLPGCKDNQVTNPGTTDTTKVDPYPHDATLKVPPANQGFQVVLGPFDGGSTQEFQKSFYQKLPNDSEAYIQLVQVESNDGCRYLNIYRSDSLDLPDHIDDSDAPLDLTKWDLLSASLMPKQTWRLTAGAAFHIKPHQQVNFQLHFANMGAGSVNGSRGKIVINFWYLKPIAQVAYRIGSLYAANTGIKIPPHTSATFLKTIKPFKEDTQVMLMEGQFHSHARRFQVSLWKDGKVGDLIYVCDSTVSWLAPNITDLSCGLTIKPGDSLAIISRYDNTTDTEIDYGPNTATQEDAGFYMFYNPIPADGKAIYDIGEGSLIESHPI